MVRIPSVNIVGSLSSKKLLPKYDAMETKPRKVEEPYKEEATITGFSFVDKELLSTAVSEIHLDIKDCASSLRVFGENCGWKHESWTSKKTEYKF